MTSIRRTPGHAIRAPRGWPLLGALLTALAALLAGCGPGVGGTGTGTSLTPGDALAAFGASAAPLCSSPLAAGLQCAGVGGTPGSTAPVAGAVALPQFLSDDPLAARAVARVAGDGIALDLACERLRFTGIWGAVPGRPARFYGVAQRTGDGEMQWASLSAQAGDAGILVTLEDAAGAALAPPRLLRPVPAAPPTACPG